MNFEQFFELYTKGKFIENQPQISVKPSLKIINEELKHYGEDASGEVISIYTKNDRVNKQHYKWATNKIFGYQINEFGTEDECISNFLRTYKKKIQACNQFYPFEVIGDSGVIVETTKVGANGKINNLKTYTLYYNEKAIPLRTTTMKEARNKAKCLVKV